MAVYSCQNIQEMFGSSPETVSLVEKENFVFRVVSDYEEYIQDRLWSVEICLFLVWLQAMFGYRLFFTPTQYFKTFYDII